MQKDKSSIPKIELRDDIDIHQTRLTTCRVDAIER